MNEAKKGYALGQFNSVCCLCRAALEEAARNICIRKKGIAQGRFNLSTHHEEYPHWGKLLEAARPKVPPWDKDQAIYERLSELHSELCAIVHGSRTADADHALDVLKRTVDLVTRLYCLTEQALCDR